MDVFAYVLLILSILKLWNCRVKATHHMLEWREESVTHSTLPFLDAGGLNRGRMGRA